MRKRPKEHYEFYVKYLLEEVFFQGISLQHGDKPDLYSESLDVGIEVTSLVHETEAISLAFCSKNMGKTRDDINTAENEQFESNGNEFLYRDGKVFGYSYDHKEYTIDDLLKTIKNKSNKIMGYTRYSSNQLFILVTETGDFSTEELESFFYNNSLLKQTNRFNKLYVADNENVWSFCKDTNVYDSMALNKEMVKKCMLKAISQTKL